MTIKHRGNRTYWYESYRQDGRVRSRYLGPADPEFVALKEALDELEREERETPDLDRLEELARREAADRLVRAFGKGVELVTAEILEAAGFHRPKRHIWRKKRG
jgi:hypothetical protein